MFWSIYIIMLISNGAVPIEEYFSVASFKSRPQCEQAINSYNSTIIELKDMKVHVRCIKTDDIVENELLKLRRASD